MATALHETADRRSYDDAEDAFTSEGGSVAHAAQPDHGNPRMSTGAIEVPTEEDRKLMASLGIDFETGMYRFENFRYDRLEDAVTYATLALQQRKETSYESTDDDADVAMDDAITLAIDAEKPASW